MRVAWPRLPTSDFDDALMQLRRYSLLEAAGSLVAPRYRLHRLTTTFLKTEVLLRWQENASEKPFIIALRTLAQYGEPDERINHLQRALSLACQHHRLLDEAGCLFSLAALAEDEGKQAAYWQQAKRLLEKMGATAWLNQHTPNNPPFLALML